MVRLSGRDNLDKKKGVLAPEFRAVALSRLHVAFYIASGNPRKAAEALVKFYSAASKLCDREKDFNKRSMPAGAPSLTKHLRNADQLKALRDFEAAKSALIEINEPIAKEIIELTEMTIFSAQRRATPKSAAPSTHASQ